MSKKIKETIDILIKNYRTTKFDATIVLTPTQNLKYGEIYKREGYKVIVDKTLPLDRKYILKENKEN